MSLPYDPRQHATPTQPYGYQPGAYAPPPIQTTDPRYLPSQHQYGQQVGGGADSQAQYPQRIFSNGRHDEELFMPTLQYQTMAQPPGTSLMPPPPPPPRTSSHSYSPPGPIQYSPMSAQQGYNPQQYNAQANLYRPHTYSVPSQAGLQYLPNPISANVSPYTGAYSPAMNASPNLAHSAGSYRPVGGQSPFVQYSPAPSSIQSSSPSTGFQQTPNLNNSYHSTQSPYTPQSPPTQVPNVHSPPSLPPRGNSPNLQAPQVMPLPGPPPLPPAHSALNRPPVDAAPRLDPQIPPPLTHSARIRPLPPQPSLSTNGVSYQAGPLDHPEQISAISPSVQDKLWQELEAAVLADPAAPTQLNEAGREMTGTSPYKRLSSAAGKRMSDSRRESQGSPLQIRQKPQVTDLRPSSGSTGLNRSPRNSRTSPLSLRSDEKNRTSPARYNGDESDDSDYAGPGADMTFYGGGLAGRTSGQYGAYPNDHSSSDLAAPNAGAADFEDKYMHPFPSLSSAPPPQPYLAHIVSQSGRRHSFEAGDEANLGTSEKFSLQQATDAADFPDMAFYPPPVQGRPARPLPALPGDAHKSFSSKMPVALNGVTLSPDAIPGQLGQPDSSFVPRATSLVNHAHQAYSDLPIRAKTDAEEKKIPGRRDGRKVSEAATLTIADVDLPVLPASKRRRFTVQKLTAEDYLSCHEPWSLSGVATWLKQVTAGETELKEKDSFDSLVALFTNKVATMNITDAEHLARQVLDALISSGALIKEEEWVRDGDGVPCSVITQLTGTGCYSSLLHIREGKGRCYAFSCARTVKKVDLTANPSSASHEVSDWAIFWKLKKEDIGDKSKKEIKRQNILHEVVHTEYEYVEQLNVLRTVYRDGLRAAQPPIIKPSRLTQFEQSVFGESESIWQVNTDLLAHLKYRQQEQGPWIRGFSDLFREWIRKAKDFYIAYSSNFPLASNRARDEAARNMLFSQFLDNARNDPRSKRLGWDSYLKAPITRLQRYSLLLAAVLESSEEGTKEIESLSLAISEIKEVTVRCDAVVDERKKQVDMEELGLKLILRPGMENDVQLELRQPGREVLKRGDLQRLGGTRMTWIDIHAILFDHYLILAKRVVERTAPNGPKMERYDVSKKPISMDLLMLEGMDDDPVTKSTVRGTSTRPGLSTIDSGHGRANSTPGNVASPGLFSVNSNPSISTMGTSNSGNSGKPMITNIVPDQASEKMLFPFRLRHLGKEDYTLFAPSAAIRQEWADALMKAKKKHAASLFAAHAEPFRLHAIADSAFAFDTLTNFATARVMLTPGTPLDRSIRDVETMFADQQRPPPACRQSVNSATTFVQPNGQITHAVGTDYGVFFCNATNPRGWYKAIAANRVSQIAVLDEFSIILVLSDKALVAHHLESVCPATPASASKRLPAQQISDHKDVSFFAVGRMKDRLLVFYKRKTSQNSVFKVLEPVLDRSGDRQRNRWGARLRGNTEFFREYGGGFYIPVECYGLSLFVSSIGVSTARGFEMLTLDTTEKPPISIPDLSQSSVTAIAQRLIHQRPLVMLRLSKLEFLLVYEGCAIYIDKHGEVSRKFVIEFEGKARSACLWPPGSNIMSDPAVAQRGSISAPPKYLILFDSDFVEVRDAENGRLRQIIPGKDVRMLDDGKSKNEGALVPPMQNGHGPDDGMPSRSIKFALAHPERDGLILILEMVLDEVGNF